MASKLDGHQSGIKLKCVEHHISRSAGSVESMLVDPKDGGVVKGNLVFGRCPLAVLSLAGSALNFNLAHIISLLRDYADATITKMGMPNIAVWRFKSDACIWRFSSFQHEEYFSEDY